MIRVLVKDSDNITVLLLRLAKCCLEKVKIVVVSSVNWSLVGQFIGRYSGKIKITATSAAISVADAKLLLRSAHALSLQERQLLLQVQHPLLSSRFLFKVLHSLVHFAANLRGPRDLRHKILWLWAFPQSILLVGI